MISSGAVQFVCPCARRRRKIFARKFFASKSFAGRNRGSALS
jgi:hypothetical protein